MEDGLLRRQLIGGLNGAEAHMSFEEAVAEFPAEAMNRRPPGVPYTPWHILEHLRITQWDILEYVRDSAHHLSPDWPEGYWPSRDAETTAEGWQATVGGFVADRKAIEAIVRSGSADLFAPLPQTPGHTIVREVRLLINHNAYHVGEFAILRQVMGTWGSSHHP
jgi:hypothetical protein